MKSNVRCWTLPAAALLIVMLCLSACAMDGSEARAPCLPIVDYTIVDQARAASEVEALQDQIAGIRESLTIQRAEWAYLNRPDRLRDLATINFDRLGLLPMQPSQFGTAEQVAFPPPPVNNVVLGLTIEQPQSISGTLAAEGAQTP